MSGGDPFDERFMRGEVLLLLQSMKLEVPDNWLRSERRIVTEDACS